MSAYVIVDVRVLSSERLLDYRRVAKASIAKYGGRYLALSSKIDVLEGDWNPGLVVLLDFPSATAARTWYESEDYAPALEIAKSDLGREMIIVDADRAPPT
jgi:uncharacterized protein (DUF1330 family)